MFQYTGIRDTLGNYINEGDVVACGMRSGSCYSALSIGVALGAKDVTNWRGEVSGKKLRVLVPGDKWSAKPYYETFWLDPKRIIIVSPGTWQGSALVNNLRDEYYRRLREN